jgi:hypothetical protein
MNAMLDASVVATSTHRPFPVDCVASAVGIYDDSIRSAGLKRLGTESLVSHIEHSAPLAHGIHQQQNPQTPRLSQNL